MKLSTLGGEFVLIFDKDKGSILGIEFKVGAHFEKSASSLLESSGTRRAKGGGRRGQESNRNRYRYFSKHYEERKDERMNDGRRDTTEVMESVQEVRYFFAVAFDWLISSMIVI
jgi:hypothetical protein